MIVATNDDTQALWDSEDAAAFRKRLKAITARVHQADEQLAAAARDWHEARAHLKRCEDAVSEWTDRPEPIPAEVFLRRLKVLSAEAEKAEERVRETKQVLNGARQKRALLWDERKAAIRKKFESFPLEEWARRSAGPDAAPANGHAGVPDGGQAAEVKAVEPEKVRVDELCGKCGFPGEAKTPEQAEARTRKGRKRKPNPHQDHLEWVATVRDPATKASEGVRTIRVKGAYASYQVAPLPDGRWALQFDLAYETGNMSGHGDPWEALPSRQACLDTFLTAARAHFGTNRTRTWDQTEGQKKVQAAMLRKLSPEKFREPEPEPVSADEDDDLDEDGETPDPLQVPGKRLSHVPLSECVQNLGGVLAHLAGRGLKTLGDLTDLAGKEGRSLDEVLTDRFAVRTADAITVMYDAMQWLVDHPSPEPECVRRCRYCGCTENECARCILLTGKPCSWAEEPEDTCTACAHIEKPEKIEKDLDKLLEAESDADAEASADTPDPLAGVEVQNGQAGTDRTEDAWPLPDAVTDKQLQKSYISDRFRGDQTKPSTVYPVQIDGQLWVTWGYAGEHPGAHWMMLPLVPRAEWAERFPGVEPHVRPRGGRTHEEQLQLYTGVVVKVGRKEYCIAPAGEGRTFVRKEGV